MNFSRVVFFLFILFYTTSYAQSSSIFNFEAKDYDHTEYAAILLNGEALIKQDMPDGPLTLKAEAAGKLSVSVVDRSTKETIKGKPIGFKIGIKDYRSNTIWMYSEETFYEIDLGRVSRVCDAGDVIVFMTIDRKYRLSRHEILGSSGC